MTLTLTIMVVGAGSVEILPPGILPVSWSTYPPAHFLGAWWRSWPHAQAAQGGYYGRQKEHSFKPNSPICNILCCDTIIISYVSYSSQNWQIGKVGNQLWIVNFWEWTIPRPFPHPDNSLPYRYWSWWVVLLLVLEPMFSYRYTMWMKKLISLFNNFEKLVQILLNLSQQIVEGYKFVLAKFRWKSPVTVQ